MLHGQKVTLDNVFELAKQEAKDAGESGSGQDSDSEEDDEDAESEETPMQLEAERMPNGELVSSKEGVSLSDDRRD